MGVVVLSSEVHSTSPPADLALEPVFYASQRSSSTSTGLQSDRDAVSAMAAAEHSMFLRHVSPYIGQPENRHLILSPKTFWDSSF
jgi:hypothetical protein